jgi:hypothetical protein
MNALVVIDAGICGFQTRIHASSEDSQNVVFKISSSCEKARKFGETLAAKGLIDSYAELGAGVDGLILGSARQIMDGACSACAVPIGAFKAMQIAAGLALPKDVSLKLSAD